MQAGWVAARGTFYGLSGCITATVYHRRCSNRQDTKLLCLHELLASKILIKGLFALS